MPNVIELDPDQIMPSEFDQFELFDCATKYHRPAMGAPRLDRHGCSQLPVAHGTTSLDYHDQDDSFDLPDEPPPGWARVE